MASSRAILNVVPSKGRKKKMLEVSSSENGVGFVNHWYVCSHSKQI